jgi:tetrahydromethanopterin S-methyltransferase subunit C
VAHCNAVSIASGCFFVLGVPSTSALFFFRVQAVYYHNRFITTFFGALLFALFGLSVLIPFTGRGEHIGTTQRCITTKLEHFGALPVFLNSFMDTLIFVAISFRIISYSLVGDTFNARMRSFFRGAGLPSLSKSILQGGQLYYLFVTRDCSPPGYQEC